MLRTTALVSLALTLGTEVEAQHSLLFTFDGDELLLDGANGMAAAGELRPDEVAILTPAFGTTPSASAFLSAEAQYTFIGDLDLDGRLVDASEDAPGGDTNAMFVKQALGAPTGTITSRDVFFSKEGADGMDASFQDGDVFRYADQGVLEYFLTETVLLAGIGQAGGDIDLDAICQTSTGDVFFSFDLTETVSGVAGVEDGSILFVSGLDCTYDLGGNITAIAANTPIVVASEDDVDAMIQASGVLTSVGGAPSSSFDLSGLELDPAGGTWVSPQDGMSYPNLLFSWDGFSNDGAILSTAGGGTIASINGVSMGSTTATTGVQVGMLPDSTGLGGLNGFCLIAEQDEPLLVENYPSNLITSSTILYNEQQVSGATPGGLVVFFWDLGPNAVGSSVPAITSPAFGGQLFGDAVNVKITGLGVADADGHVRFPWTLPSAGVGSGRNIVNQVYDLTTTSFGAPAGLQFL